MKRLAFITLPLLALAAPLTAQEKASTPTVVVEALPPADRLAAAAPVIDKLWPLGTYRKMMDGQMSDMVNAMVDPMFNMKVEDFITEKDIPESKKGQTMGAIAGAKDPHYRERMRITTDIMFKEMIPIVDKVEPSVRSALTTIYARQFTVQQLNDLDRFLSTPTGRLYAQNWVSSFYGREMLKSMETFVPELAKAMPGIMEKTEAATAHLTPVHMDSEDDHDPAINASVNWSSADKKAIAQQEATVAGTEEQLADQRGRLEWLRLEARLRAGGKLPADDQDYLESLRETYAKGKK